MDLQGRRILLGVPVVVTDRLLLLGLILGLAEGRNDLFHCPKSPNDTTRFGQVGTGVLSNDHCLQLQVANGALPLMGVERNKVC